MRYTEAMYAQCNPFNDDSDTRMQTFKLVRTRKPHKCSACITHSVARTIPAGSHAMVERAIVEGEWSSTYACMECMDLLVDQGE